MKHICLIVFALVIMQLGQAQPVPDFAPSQGPYRPLSDHSVTLDGRNDPLGIPEGVKLRAFFKQLSLEYREKGISDFEHSVRPLFALSEDDLSVITEAVTTDLEPLAEENRRLISDGCDRYSPQRDPIARDIAAHFNVVHEEWVTSLERHYFSFVERLSAIARARVIQAANVHVSRISYTSLNYEGLAAESPEVMHSLAKLMCTRLRKRQDGIGYAIDDPVF
jgi:hypothetical protein